MENVMDRTVRVIEQPDSFAVIVQDDEEGRFDGLYSWGCIDEETRVTKGEAREAADWYAADLAKRLGGKVTHEKL